MAYGKVRSVPKPLGDLPARIYPIPTNASPTRFAILTVPFDFNAEDGVDATLAQKLCDDFTKYICNPQLDVMLNTNTCSKRM
jgi:hypothetical protein